ncbi:MAG: type II secretion system protein [Armatimonadota bacterium]
MNGHRRRKAGFTLIEVLIVIVVIAVLASIVIPRLMGAGRQAKESSLRAHLQELRNAINLFQSHTGLYPAVLGDIMNPATSPPATGVDVTGTSQPISAADYKGPYLTTASMALPNNPITGGNGVGSDWVYSTTAPTVGEIHAASGTALDGTDYSTW